MTCAICQHYPDCEMAKLRLGFCASLLGYLHCLTIPKKEEDYANKSTERL